MYRKFYGLIHKPFELTPDPQMLFLSEAHKEALAVLRYGVVSNKSFLLLTGGIGTGKTTLIQTLAESLKKPIKLCLLSNPTLEPKEFFYFLASQLGMPYDGNKAKFLLDFEQFLERFKQKNQKVLLIIDEAHVVPVALLEEIRLLSNQAGKIPDVLSIFLIGQSELLRRLTDERLQPLKQRIGIRFDIGPFSNEETVQYILSRLKKAGAKRGRFFSAKAMGLIHQATHGNPRLINILCDHCLLSGFSNEQFQIDETLVNECVHELNGPGEDATFQLKEHGVPFIQNWRRVGTSALLVAAVLIVVFFIGRERLGLFY